MTRCYICGRAMTGEPRYLPLAICRRARCRAERQHLKEQIFDTYTRFAWVALADPAGSPSWGGETRGD